MLSRRPMTRFFLIAFFLAIVTPNFFAQEPASTPSALVERVGDLGFIQLQAESFKQLDPKQKALAYWLSQASIAIDPIIYDQNSRFGLRQKRLLEDILAHSNGINPAVLEKSPRMPSCFGEIAEITTTQPHKSFCRNLPSRSCKQQDASLSNMGDSRHATEHCRLCRRHSSCRKKSSC